MIVYLHGFASGPGSHKARLFSGALSGKADGTPPVTPPGASPDEGGLGVLVPALDEGDFENLTLTGQLRVLARTIVTAEGAGAAGGPLVLIGSSMGGYLAALYDCYVREGRGDRLGLPEGKLPPPPDALVLMAPAVDFASRWRERLGAEEIARWRERGFTLVQHHALGRLARLSYRLMEDADRHEPWPRIGAPALVFHGRRDDVVPLDRVQRWTEMNPGARLVLYDDGHELVESGEAMVAETRLFLAGLRGNPG